MSAIDELKATMVQLRGPDGCPWDREQTHQSLSRCLIEECAELLETIDREDMDHMREELGDVLLQVVFHAQIAEEAGFFSFEDVAAEINEKLVRRHPHVFGSATAKNSDEVHQQWDEIKASEKLNRPRAEGVFKDLPAVLPALLYAWDFTKQLQKKEMLDQIPGRKRLEELAETLNDETAGEMLFEIAAACRLARIDPEAALRRYSERLRVAAEKEAE